MYACLAAVHADGLLRELPTPRNTGAGQLSILFVPFRLELYYSMPHTPLPVIEALLY